MPDFNEDNLEKAAKQLSIKLKIHRMLAMPMRPHMRPHTWVFLQQIEADESICLGIVFNTWPPRFNSLRFSASYKGRKMESHGSFVHLDNDTKGLLVEERWCWESLLHEFKGLSAGNL